MSEINALGDLPITSSNPTRSILSAYYIDSFARCETCDSWPAHDDVVCARCAKRLEGWRPDAFMRETDASALRPIRATLRKLAKGKGAALVSPTIQAWPASSSRCTSAKRSAS